MEKARELFQKIFKYLMRPEMRILPGQLAFFLVITVIPLLALIATIAAALSISTESIRIAIDSSVPKEIADLLNGIIENGGINFNIFVFYFSAFLLASNGTYSMINVSNEIYKVKPGSTNAMQITGKILTILKYPIILAVLFINIKLMYIIAPDEEIPSKTTNKGALFTTVLWVISTEVFAFYVGKFTSYDVFYGSISNILIMFIWVYWLSYIFVLGMVINASTYKGDKIE